MKKRLISLVLCTCMLIVGLVGCGKSKKDDTETQEGTYSATEIIMGDTSHESENEMYDTELEFETESEEPVPENVVYSISTYTVNSWTQEFLKLYLGCHVNYYLGNVKVEPVNITTMRKHSNIVGMLTVAEGMRVKSDYSDNLFNLKNSNLYYRIHTNNTGSKNNINYRVSVSLLESNFDTFRYYQGTDAGLGLVHKVTFFIDDNEIKENYYFVSAWVNNAGKPEEWLMESGIFISETEYKKVQGQAFDKMLINEDDEKEKEEINKSDAEDFIIEYRNIVDSIGVKRMLLVKTSGSDIPYLIISSDYGARLYHYQNGSVGEYIDLSAYSYTSVGLIEGNKLLVSGESGGGMSKGWEYLIYEYKDNQFIVTDKVECIFKYIIQTETEKYEYMDKDGNAISKAEYDAWISKHQKNIFYGYDSIEEANKNMIEWE